jgi:hypothetical protein
MNEQLESIIVEFIRMNEIMLHNVNNIQLMHNICTIIRDYPKNEAQGELEGTNCMKSKGRLPGSSPLRSDGLR